MANSLVLHSASRHYDLLAWILTLGREQALRERLVDLARLQPGETVLDVGCGTGSLAVTAKRRVGPTGSVRGIDASLEMIEQARAKAARAGIDVSLDVGRAEALPCPDGSVDVVLSTLVMHHLPRSVREAFAAEIHRVLKPGGHALVVDFEPPAFIPHIADSAAASVDAACCGDHRATRGASPSRAHCEARARLWIARHFGSPRDRRDRRCSWRSGWRVSRSSQEASSAALSAHAPRVALGTR